MHNWTSIQHTNWKLQRYNKFKLERQGTGALVAVFSDTVGEYSVTMTGAHALPSGTAVITFTKATLANELSILCSLEGIDKHALHVWKKALRNMKRLDRNATTGPCLAMVA